MKSRRRSNGIYSRADWGLRQGISLLEVLIAIMVLSIGLLGLAALIPVGKFEVAQAMIADRGATMGRLAARDLQIRGLLRPEMLLFLLPGSAPSQAPNSYSSTTNSTPPPLTWLTNTGSPTLIGLPYAIDPLMMAHPQNLTLPATTSPKTPHAVFPYVTSNVPKMGTPPPIVRCTISGYDAPVVEASTVANGATGWPFATNTPAGPAATGLYRMDYRQAERLFRSADDLTFTLPARDSQRPDQMYQYLGTQPVQRQFQGDFSWLVTVSPALADFFVIGPTSTTNTAILSLQKTQVPRTFNVSIVVFHKRVPIVDTNLNVASSVPSERTVFADILGTGFGGGDVMLRVKGRTQTESKNLLAVKPQQWMVLVGTIGSTSGEVVANRVVLAWYRIVKVADNVEDVTGDGSNWGRRVTLAGPDWLVNNPMNGNVMFADVDSLVLPSDGNQNLTTVYAGLFEGTIAVYDRSITLDGFSLWQ